MPQPWRLDSRNRASEKPGPVQTINEALRAPVFWLIATVMFIFSFVGLGTGVHLMPYLGDLGHPQATASLIVALSAAMTVPGKVAMGVVSDRWGVRWTVVLGAMLIIVGMALLIAAQPLSVAVLFALVYGFAIGAPLMFNPMLASQYLGLAHFGAIFGVLNLISTVGAALGPVASGAVYDLARSYVPMYVVFAACIAVAGVCGFTARRAGKAQDVRGPL